MEKKNRKRFGRSDGLYLKHIDPFMRFLPFIMKGRNEAAVYFTQEIDVTDLKEWLNQRNRADGADKSSAATIFHAVMAALVKTVVERPQMNRFIVGRRVYQRYQFRVAFVVKSEFRDDAKEEIVIITFDENDTFTSVSEKIRSEVHQVRAASKENETKRHGAVNWLNTLMNLPRFLLSGLVRLLSWVDYHGWLPRFVIEADPMHASIFMSNLASIQVDAPYHHLYEWGTTSVFMTMGVTKKLPQVMKDGEIVVRDMMNFAFTVDERISDGFYYARSIRRFKQLLEHPDQLDKPSKPGKI